MPVQINEMIIRANIVEPGDNQSSGGKSQSGGDAGGETSNKDEIVKECAALVLEIINNKSQR